MAERPSWTDMANVLRKAAEAARDEALEMHLGDTAAQAIYHAVKTIARRELASKGVNNV